MRISLKSANLSTTFYQNYGKRFFDFSCAILGLICLLPLFVILSIVIKMDSPGPIFFLHERVGRYNKTFRLIKFRSMVIDASVKGPQVTKGEDPRITRIGRILRDYKLDELPQLINVVWGELSIVGPRPEVAKYVNLFKDDYNKILLNKPGITDYATIEFRNEEEILSQFSDVEQGYVLEILPRKIELYLKYVGNYSFFEDLRIIILTLKKIVTR